MRNLEFPYVSLFRDAWNDFGFRTRFIATLHLSKDDEVQLGPLKIAAGDGEVRFGELPVLVDSLPLKSASLGESVAYYRKLKSQPVGVRRRYLSLMRDIVAKPDRRNYIRNEDLWEKSFMREASSRHALKRGGYYIDADCAQVAPPNFSFEMKIPGATDSHKIELDFRGERGLPNRSILFIGRNGTGKTKALASLVPAVMPGGDFDPASMVNMPRSRVDPDIEISRLIAISYNAFDNFPLPRKASEKAPRADGVLYKSRGSYKYCGLRNPDGAISTSEIGQMLGQALAPVVDSDRTDVLLQVLSTLLDPGLAQLLTSNDEDEQNEAVASLSAGQRLVVAIFSNIVGFIEDNSLLLIDEPETNLHPGLLSTFIAALHEILDEFDSFAVVASHSPILLQQVPSQNVRVFRRDSTDRPRVSMPDFETFGEDLGELTRRVLGLADPEKDFTDVLTKLFAQHKSARAVADLFDYPLGVPAMAHLYGLEEDMEADDE